MRLLILFAFIIFNIPLSAQPIHIYFAKGDAYVKTGSKMVKAKEGVEIQADATLILQDKAVAVLFQSERAVVIKEAGEYTVEQITELFENTKRSVTDRYITYIWNQAHADDKDIEDAGEGNMGVKGMVSRGEGGIISPVDSVVVIHEAFVIDFDKDVIPGYLFIYEKRKPLSKFEIDSVSRVVEYGGILEKGKWYGMAAAINEQAPYTGIQYFKWASAVQSQDIQMEMAKMLGEIEDFPQEVKDQIIQTYLNDNRYIYYVTKE